MSVGDNVIYAIDPQWDLPYKVRREKMENKHF